MSDSANYEQDWWFYPIKVDDDNNTLVVSLDGFESIITIASGTYYWWLPRAARVASGALNANNDFGEALFQAFDGSGWELGSLEEETKLVTPKQSFLLTQTGIDLTPDFYTGTLPWVLDFEDPRSTVDPLWFGFPRGARPSYNGGARVISDVSMYGIWKPTSTNPRAIFASDKRGYPVLNTRWSTRRRRGRLVSRWYQETLRTFVYQLQRACYVYGNRALDVKYADICRVGLGDVTAGFDRCWQHLSAGDEVFVLHDTPELEAARSGLDNTFLNGRLEDVALSLEADASDMRSIAQTIRTEGEMYDLSINALVVPVGDFEGYPQ